MRKINILALYFTFGILLLTKDVHGQDWKRIIPLRTTCEDLMKILNVDTCKIPVSDYKFQDFWISINVSEGGEEKWSQGMPRGTVTRVMVTVRKSVLLKDFEGDLEYFKTNLQDFKILPDDDLPDSKIYENNSKGISFTVRTIEAENNRPGEKYVIDVTLDPPKCKK